MSYFIIIPNASRDFAQRLVVTREHLRVSLVARLFLRLAERKLPQSFSSSSFLCQFNMAVNAFLADIDFYSVSMCLFFCLYFFLTTTADEVVTSETKNLQTNKNAWKTKMPYNAEDTKKFQSDSVQDM